MTALLRRLRAAFTPQWLYDWQARRFVRALFSNARKQ